MTAYQSFYNACINGDLEIAKHAYAINGCLEWFEGDEEEEKKEDDSETIFVSGM